MKKIFQIIDSEGNVETVTAQSIGDVMNVWGPSVNARCMETVRVVSIQETTQTVTPEWWQHEGDERRAEEARQAKEQASR